jgi:hypothetical protein
MMRCLKSSLIHILVHARRPGHQAGIESPHLLRATETARHVLGIAKSARVGLSLNGRPPLAHTLSLSLSLWRSSIMISRPGGRSCMACLACGIPSRAPEPFPPLLHDSRWCGVAVHKSRFSLAHSVSSFLAGRRAPSSGARRDVRVLRSFR